MPIYKQSDGTYRVQITYMKDGKKFQKVRKNPETATKAGALRVEYELLQKYKPALEDLEDSQKEMLKLTIDQVVEDYRKSTINSLRKTTRIHFEKNYRLYIKDQLGNYSLDLFTKNIQPLILWKNRIDAASYKLSYKNDIYKSLHVIFNFAKKIYGLPFNPLDRLGPFKDSIQSFDDKEMHYWNLDQFLAFDAELKRMCETKAEIERTRFYGYYVFFNILFFCGLRKGEAYPLKWSDIKDKGGYKVISVTKSMSQKVQGEDREYLITPPKNRSSWREIPLCDRLVNILSEHYERYKRVYGFEEYKDEFYICGGLDPVTDSNVDKIKNSIAKKLNLPPIRVHDFRHSFVSLLINQNINIKIISKLVGHSNVDLTWNLYGHLYPDKDNEAISTLNLLLNGKK